jgi:hypothetical protein
MRSIEVGRSPALVIGMRGAMPLQWAPHLGADAPVLPKEDKGREKAVARVLKSSPRSAHHRMGGRKRP